MPKKTAYRKAIERIENEILPEKTVVFNGDSIKFYRKPDGGMVIVQPDWDTRYKYFRELTGILGPENLKDVALKFIDYLGTEELAKRILGAALYRNIFPTRKLERKAISAKTRWKVFKRDKFVCTYCGRGKSDTLTLHIDHIKPVKLGGTNRLDNLITSCSECNLGKGVDSA